MYVALFQIHDVVKNDLELLTLLPCLNARIIDVGLQAHLMLYWGLNPGFSAW